MGQTAQPAHKSESGRSHNNKWIRLRGSCARTSETLDSRKITHASAAKSCSRGSPAPTIIYIKKQQHSTAPRSTIHTLKPQQQDHALSGTIKISRSDSPPNLRYIYIYIYIYMLYIIYVYVSVRYATVVFLV